MDRSGFSFYELILFDDHFRAKFVVDGGPSELHHCHYLFTSLTFFLATCKKQDVTFIYVERKTR